MNFSKLIYPTITALMNYIADGDNDDCNESHEELTVRAMSDLHEVALPVATTVYQVVQDTFEHGPVLSKVLITYGTEELAQSHLQALNDSKHLLELEYDDDTNYRVLTSTVYG